METLQEFNFGIQQIIKQYKIKLEKYSGFLPDYSEYEYFNYCSLKLKIVNDVSSALNVLVIFYPPSEQSEQLKEIINDFNLYAINFELKTYS